MTDSRARILAIDDTPANLLTLGALLGQDYDLQMATSGAKGIELARANPPDMIMLDVMMPEMDGYETCRRLLADPLTRDIPIIFLTALNRPEDEALGLEIGAVDFISKPVNPTVMRSRIQTHLRLKRIEAEHRISEQRLNLAINGVNDGIWDWDLRSNQLYLSPKWKEMLGYQDHELVNAFSTFESLLHPDDAPQVLGALQRYLQGELPAFKVECRMQHRNGEWRWIQARGDALRDEQGQPYRMLGPHSDITERKQNEQRLEYLLAEQKVVLENELIGIVRVRDRHFLWANPAYERMLGYQRGELDGLATSVVYPSQAAFLQLGNAAYPILKQGKLFRSEIEHVRKEGGLVLVDLCGAMLNPQNGESMWVFIDNTERKDAQQLLKKLSIAVEQSPASVVITDVAANIEYVNPRFNAVTGYSADEALGQNPRILQSGLTPEAVYQDMWETLTRGLIWKGELNNKRKDGSVYWEEAQISPVKNDEGDITHYVAIKTDISERKQAEATLQLAANVFSHASEAIVITSADGRIIDVNAPFVRITGYSRDEVLGQTPRILKSGRQEASFYQDLWQALLEHGQWRGEIWNARKNGEAFPAMLTISAVRDNAGITQQYVALFSDISALKEHEQQLEQIAHYDAMTGLPNRVLLADRLHQAMVQAHRRKQPLAVAYLDLDGFKAVNDTFGHDAGDQLLTSMAERMKRTLRQGDTLARLGGDEFVAVLLDLDDSEASIPMLARLLAAASEPTQIGDETLQLSASVGVTFYPQVEEVDADQLLRQADQAMYQAKMAGKNRFHVYDLAQDHSVRGHHESIEQIRRALVNQEFVLHYQPKVNMRNGKVIGAEALIRWQHGERGLLPPSAFLPVIEYHPLAIELGEWVISSALSQIDLWHQAGLDIPVSVNVGALQLQQENFVDRLRTLLAEHPEVPASCLELEVLETSALQDVMQISRVIEACRAIGVMFALDDFGTGYSSLTYLKRLPATVLKIDQSFVRDMLDDPEDLAILEGVLGLASAFRRQAIAEGVETVAHGEMLLQLGCELAQGYGIARPMPAEQLPDWAANWLGHPSWINRPAVKRSDLALLFASVEHRAWILALEKYLKGESGAAPEIQLQHCHFGAWLEAEGLARYGSTQAFHGISQLHRQVHALAQELIALHQGGEPHAALARLDELHALRDELLQRL
jgi:diguanylate cyclase (GGDEF)-like protein/PAS domain S-box-containing protein